MSAIWKEALGGLHSVSPWLVMAGLLCVCGPVWWVQKGCIWVWVRGTRHRRLLPLLMQAHAVPFELNWRVWVGLGSIVLSKLCCFKITKWEARVPMFCVWWGVCAAHCVNTVGFTCWHTMDPWTSVDMLWGWLLLLVICINILSNACHWGHWKKIIQIINTDTFLNIFPYSLNEQVSCSNVVRINGCLKINLRPDVLCQL